MMKIALFIAAVAAAAPVMALDWNTRDGDTRLSAAELDDRLRGRLLVFFDDGQSHFYHDGRYTFAYGRGAGGYAYGYFDVTDEGAACIAYLNGFTRCDLYVLNSGGLVMITEAGDRFPVREARDAGPDPVPDRDH